MNCNTAIPSTANKATFNMDHELAQQKIQYLTNHLNNSSLNLTSKLQQDLEQQQLNNNQHFLNMFSKFMPMKLTGLSSANQNLGMKNSQNPFKSQHNHFAANPANVFQTLLAANMLRSNIQNTTNSNSNSMNCVPFNNANMSVNMATNSGKLSSINNSPKIKNENSKGNIYIFNLINREKIHNPTPLFHSRR